MNKKKSTQIENRLYEFRVLERLSQEKLGELVGVSRQTINSIEKNKYIPSLPVSLKLAKYFNVPLEDIFSLKDE